MQAVPTRPHMKQRSMASSRGARARVLVAHANVLFRAGLCALILAEPDFTVVGEANSGPQAISMAVQRQADLVLLQAECPGDGVVLTVQKLRRLHPAVRIIVLSHYDEPDLVRRSLGAAVQVYPVKSMGRFELITALRSAGRNDDASEPSGPPGRQVGNAEGPVANGLPARLSEREQEVLNFVARGLSNGEIARKLDIVEGTVKRHLRNIFAKLGARSRIDAVNRAVMAGTPPVEVDELGSPPTVH